MKIKKIIENLGLSQAEWNSFLPSEKMELLIGYIRDIEADNRNLKAEITSIMRSNKRSTIKHDRIVSRLGKRNKMLKRYVNSYSKRKSKRGN